MTKEEQEAAEEERFQAAMRRSAEAVFRVAEWLHSRMGIWVRVSPLVIRKQFGDRHAHSDKCDLDICKAGTENWKRVEVKRREISFTKVEEYPFRTIYFGKRNDAHAYFITNASMSHAALIRHATKEFWSKDLVEDFDKKRGYTMRSYACPTDVAEFISLKVEHKDEVRRDVG